MLTYPQNTGTDLEDVFPGTQPHAQKSHTFCLSLVNHPLFTQQVACQKWVSSNEKDNQNSVL